MSGVTVAQSTRSIDVGSTPARSSAWRAAGSAMSVSASSSVAKRRSWMPVRSTIHSSVVSTIVASSSFVTTFAGHVHAEPGDPDPRAVRLADHCSTAKVRVPRTASSPSTVARALPRPIGPRTCSSAHSSVELVAGRDDALEAHVVDAGEERELAAVLLLDEHGDRAGLRERLDHLHAGHDRVAGKVPGAVLVGHASSARRRASRDRARATSSSSRNGSRCGRICSISDLPNGAFTRRLLEPGAQAVAGAVRVALRRPDRHAARGRDLLERVAERVLQHDDARLRLGRARAGSARELVALGPSVARRSAAVASAFGQRLPRRAAARSTSRHVLTTRRCSHVANCASPRNCPIRVHTFASDSCAASRASSGSRRIRRASFSTRGCVPRAERLEGLPVAVLRALDQDRVAQPLVRRAALGARRGRRIGRLRRARRLHLGLLYGAWPIRSPPTSSLPRLRGRFGRDYPFVDGASRPSGCSPTTPRRAPSPPPTSRPPAAGGSAATGARRRARACSPRSSSGPQVPTASLPELSLVAGRCRRAGARRASPASTQR